MGVHWNDREDEENPEYQRSRAFIAGGWFTAEVYHTTREDEHDVPWNACLDGKNKGHALLGYESMDEAKRAVEEKIPEVLEEIRRALT